MACGPTAGAHELWNGWNVPSLGAPMYTMNESAGPASVGQLLIRFPSAQLMPVPLPVTVSGSLSNQPTTYCTSDILVAYLQFSVRLHDGFDDMSMSLYSI